VKPDILSPSQVEKLMILGQATQKDGVRLINSHRALQDKFQRLQEFVEEHHGYHVG